MQVKERRKEERDEGLKHLFETGREKLTIQRKGFVEVMQLVMAWARTSYTARAEVTGVETYEKTEVTLEALAGILLQDKKCRVVMHYDPAAEKVYFEREDEPEATT